MAKGKKKASKKKKSSASVPKVPEGGGEGGSERCSVSLKRVPKYCPDRFSYTQAVTCGGNVCPPSFAAVPGNSDVARIGKFRQTCPTVIVVTPNISAAGDKNLPFVKNVRRTSIRDPGDCPCMVPVKALSPLLVRSPPKRTWDSLPDAPKPGVKQEVPCYQPPRRYPRCREDPPCFAEPCVGQCLNVPQQPSEAQTEGTVTSEIFEEEIDGMQELDELDELDELEELEEIEEEEVCEPCELDEQEESKPNEPKPVICEPCEPEPEPQLEPQPQPESICKPCDQVSEVVCEPCEPEPVVCEPCDEENEVVCEPCEPEPGLCDPCDQVNVVVCEPYEPEPVITYASEDENQEYDVVCEPCEPEPATISELEPQDPQLPCKPCQPDPAGGPCSKEICQLSFNYNDFSSSHNAVAPGKSVTVCFGPPECMGVSNTVRSATRSGVSQKSTQSARGDGRKFEGDVASLSSKENTTESSESTDRSKCCPTEPGSTTAMGQFANKNSTKYASFKTSVTKTADAATSVISNQVPMVPLKMHVPKTADAATSQSLPKASKSTSKSQSDLLQKPPVCKPCAEVEKRKEVTKCKPCADIVMLTDVAGCKPCAEVEEPSECKPCAQGQRKPPVIPPCPPCTQTRGGRTPTSLMSTALAVVNEQNFAYMQTPSKAMASTQTSKLLGTPCQPCQQTKTPVFTLSDVVPDSTPVVQDPDAPYRCPGKMCKQTSVELKRQDGGSGASVRPKIPSAGEITPCCTPSPPLQPMSADYSSKSIAESVCTPCYGEFRDIIGAPETSADAAKSLEGGAEPSAIAVSASEPSYTRLVCKRSSTRVGNSGLVKQSRNNIGRVVCGSQSYLSSEPSYTRLCVSRPETRPREITRENHPIEIVCGAKHRDKSGRCYGVAGEYLNMPRGDYTSIKFICRPPSPRPSAAQEINNAYGAPQPKNCSTLSGEGVKINQYCKQKQLMKGTEPQQEEVGSKQYTYASGESTNNWPKSIQRRTVACSITPRGDPGICRTSQPNPQGNNTRQIYSNRCTNNPATCTTQDNRVQNGTGQQQIASPWLKGSTYGGLQARVICEKSNQDRCSIQQPCDGGKIITRVTSVDAQSRNSYIQQDIRADDSNIKYEANRRSCVSKTLGVDRESQRRCLSTSGTQHIRHTQRNVENERGSPLDSCACSSCYSSRNSSSRSYENGPQCSKEVCGSALSVRGICGSGRSDASQQEDFANKCIPVGKNSQPLNGVIKIVIYDGNAPETSYKLQKITDQGSASDRNNSEDNTEENKTGGNIEKSSRVCDSMHKSCSCLPQNEPKPKCVNGSGEYDNVPKRCTCAKYVEKGSQCEARQRKFIVCSGDNVDNADTPNTEFIRCPSQKCYQGQYKNSENNITTLKSNIQNQKPERMMDRQVSSIDNTHQPSNCPRGRIRMNYNTPECVKMESLKPDFSKCIQAMNLKLKSEISPQDKLICKNKGSFSPVSRKIICMNIEEVSNENDDTDKEELEEMNNGSKIEEEGEILEEEEMEEQENMEGLNDTLGTEGKARKSSRQSETKRESKGRKSRDKKKGSMKTENEQEITEDNSKDPKKCKKTCVAVKQFSFSDWCGASKGENCRDIPYTDRCGSKAYELESVPKEPAPKYCPGKGNIEICGKLACKNEEVTSQDSEVNVKIMNLPAPKCPGAGSQITGPNYPSNQNGVPLQRKPGQAGTVIILDKPKTSYPNFRQYMAPGTTNVPRTIPLKELLDSIAPGTVDELPLSLPSNLTVPDYSAMEITVISIAAREEEPVPCEKIRSQFPRCSNRQPNVGSQQFPLPVNGATMQVPYSQLRNVCTSQFPGLSGSSKYIQPTNQPGGSIAPSIYSKQPTLQTNSSRVQDSIASSIYSKQPTLQTNSSRVQDSIASSIYSKQPTLQTNSSRVQDSLVEVDRATSLVNGMNEKVNGSTKGSVAKNGQEPFPGVPKTQNIYYSQIQNQEQDQIYFQSKQAKNSMPDNTYLLDCNPPKACKKEISVDSLSTEIDGPCPCPPQQQSKPVATAVDLSLEYRRVIDKHFHSIKGIIYTGHLEPLNAPIPEVKEPEPEEEEEDEGEETIAVVGLETNMSMDGGKTCKVSCPGAQGEKPPEEEIEPPEMEQNSVCPPDSICKTSQQDTGKKSLIRTICNCTSKKAETNYENVKSPNSTFSDVYDPPEEELTGESREQSTSYHKMEVPSQNNRKIGSRHSRCYSNQETNPGHPYQSKRQEPTIVEHCLLKSVGSKYSEQGGCKEKQNVCKISRRKVCKSTAKNTTRQICKRSKTVMCKRVTPAPSEKRGMKSVCAGKQGSTVNANVLKQSRVICEPPPPVNEQPLPVENAVLEVTAPAHCPRAKSMVPKCEPPPGKTRASCMPGTYRLCRDDSEDCRTSRQPVPKKETPVPKSPDPMNRFEEQLVNRDLWQVQEDATTEETFSTPSLYRRWEKVEKLIDDPVEEQCNRWRQCEFVGRQRYGPKPCVPAGESQDQQRYMGERLMSALWKALDGDKGGMGSNEDRKSLANFMQARLMSAMQHKTEKK